MGFFCLDVLLHEFCNYLVLMNDLHFQLLDPLLFVFEFIDFGRQNLEARRISELSQRLVQLDR